MIIWLHTTTTNLSFYLFSTSAIDNLDSLLLCSLKFSDLLSVLWCNKDSELLAWFGILWLHIRPCFLLHLQRRVNKTNNFFLPSYLCRTVICSDGRPSWCYKQWWGWKKEYCKYIKFYMHVWLLFVNSFATQHPLRHLYLKNVKKSLYFRICLCILYLSL